MPLYDWKCGRCGVEFERFAAQKTSRVKCLCGGEGKRLLCVSQVSHFKKRVLQDLDVNPVEVHSAKEADREAKRVGVVIDTIKNKRNR